MMKSRGDDRVHRHGEFPRILGDTLLRFAFSVRLSSSAVCGKVAWLLGNQRDNFWTTFGQLLTGSRGDLSCWIFCPLRPTGLGCYSCQEGISTESARGLESQTLSV